MDEKLREKVLEELQSKSFDFRDGFIAGMLYAQKVYNPEAKINAD